MTDPIQNAIDKTLAPQPQATPRGNPLQDALGLLRQAKTEIDTLRASEAGAWETTRQYREDVLMVEREAEGRWQTIQMLRRRLRIVQGVNIGLAISTVFLAAAFLWLLAQ